MLTIEERLDTNAHEWKMQTSPYGNPAAFTVNFKIKSYKMFSVRPLIYQCLYFNYQGSIFEIHRVNCAKMQTEYVE